MAETTKSKTEPDVKGQETAAIVANEQTAKASRVQQKATTATQKNATAAALQAEAKAEAAERMAADAKKAAKEARAEADRLNPKKFTPVKGVKKATFEECNALYFKNEAIAIKERESKKEEVKKAVDKIYCAVKK